MHRNRFLFNNQPDALIIQIYSVIKILHVSDIFSALHQEFSAVRRALVSLMQLLMTASKQSQDGTQLIVNSARHARQLSSSPARQINPYLANGLPYLSNPAHTLGAYSFVTAIRVVTDDVLIGYC